MQAPLSFGAYVEPISAIRMIAKDEGITGLYRGIGAVLLGGIPGTFLYLSGYEVCNSSYDQIAYI